MISRKPSPPSASPSSSPGKGNSAPQSTDPACPEASDQRRTSAEASPEPVASDTSPSSGSPRSSPKEGKPKQKASKSDRPAEESSQCGGMLQTVQCGTGPPGKQVELKRASLSLGQVYILLGVLLMGMFVLSAALLTYIDGRLPPIATGQPAQQLPVQVVAPSADELRRQVESLVSAYWKQNIDKLSGELLAHVRRTVPEFR